MPPSTIWFDMLYSWTFARRLFLYFIGIFHIFKYIITISRTGSGRIAWDSNSGCAFSGANLLVIGSLDFLLCQPYLGRAALVRPQKYFRPLGWGHNNLQSSHSSCPPENLNIDWEVIYIFNMCTAKNLYRTFVNIQNSNLYFRKISDQAAWGLFNPKYSCIKAPYIFPCTIYPYKTLHAAVLESLSFAKVCTVRSNCW